MTGISPHAARTYDLDFQRWISKNVNGGHRLNMCMQCGACSGSCPIGGQMDFGPRRIFMMVRAGKKDAVLTSNTIWNCVSCYNSEVRCPRQVPVTHILDSLATLAVREGYGVATGSETARFAKAFFWSARKFGRTDERLITAKYYFSFGLAEAVKRTSANQKIALGMVRKKRMHLGLPHKIKRVGELRKILDKAAEIEARELGG